MISDRYKYANVRVVLAEPNTEIRQGLKSAMRDLGFTQVEATGNLRAVSDEIDAGRVDLLIGDTNFEDHAVATMVRDIRRSFKGPHPFPVSIATTGDATSEKVKIPVDAGFDDVLVKPLTVNQIVDRIHRLIDRRKAFVVTSDYIGPDRRRAERPPEPGRMQVPLLVVPNPLQVAATGSMTSDGLQNAINDAVKEIDQQRVERHAFQIGWLVERITPKYLYDKVDEECVGYLKTLVYVSEDLSGRLSRTSYAHVAKLCASMEELAQRMHENPKKPSQKDIDLLPNVASAIRQAFKVDEATADLTHDIAESLKKQNA